MTSSITPWLTVVMPVHNGADFLSETLDSLAGEVDDGVEIILIDSSDDEACKEIVQRYEGRLSIDYSYRGDLKPWPAKTNEAVRRAKAPHIAMLHQDDLWLTGRVEQMRAAIRAHPSATLYLAPSHIVDSRSKSLGIWRCPFGKKTLWQGDDLLERLLVQNFIAIPAPIISRESWLAVGGMDEYLWYTADWDIYLKLAGQGSFVYNTVPTTAFRIHSRSLTIKGSKDISGFKDQMEIVLNRYSDNICKDKRKSTFKMADLSISINIALAALLTGKLNKFPATIIKLFSINPCHTVKYFKYSRLLERLIPRIKMYL